MNKKSNKPTEYRSLLRDAGLKVTPARLAVLKLLDKTHLPISIHTIKEQLKSTAIDQATIYRMVRVFEEKAIVRQVDFQHGHAHYELRSYGDRDHHHHVVCEKCGKVANISKCDTADIEKQALKISGFHKISDHSLEFFGLCSRCARNN